MAKKKTAPAKGQTPVRGKGLRVKRVPDVTGLTDLRRAILADAPPPAAPAEATVGLFDGAITEEQRAIQAAQEVVSPLLRRDTFRQLADVMTGFRQAYAVAYRELQECLAEERVAHEARGLPWPELAEDFFVQYAMYQASKKFSEHDLMKTVTQSILPWMADVIDRHTEADEKDAREDRRAADEARRARPVPIGLRHTPHQEDETLSRQRSLVLVGWRNAVLWLLDRICAHALASEAVMTVRLMTTPPRREDQHHALVRLGSNLWHGCANSERRLALCMGEHVADKLSHQPDLLVCDHLPLAYTGGLAFRPEAAVAGDAHRQFRRWCDGGGTAFLGAVCLDSMDAPDVTTPDYEQLRTFTDLRPVTARPDGEGDIVVTVGNQAAVFVVAPGELERYGRGGLALPAGVLE